MSPTMMHAIRKCCEHCRLPYHLMPSGAGHDAMNVAPLTDTGMIFIPCKNGVSHNPRRTGRVPGIRVGCQVLSELLPGRAKHR